MTKKKEKQIAKEDMLCEADFLLTLREEESNDSEFKKSKILDEQSENSDSKIEFQS